VIAGTAVQIPVRLIPPVTPASAIEIDVSVDGIMPIDASLFWISAEPIGASIPSDPLSGWIKAPRQWSSRSPSQLVRGELPPGEGFWALLIDVPRSAHNRDLVIDGRRAPIQWLELPTDTAHERGVGSDLFHDISPALQRTMANSGQDPLNRWRTRLLNDRLRGPRRSVIDSHKYRFEHEAIEAMAAQAEWRWRLALDGLSRIDPFLGAELLDRLTAVARFDAQTQAPVWPTDEVSLNLLRTALLDPAMTDSAKIEIARDTLHHSPSSTGWIIDDAGWVDPTTGRTIVLLGVTDRLGRSGLVRGSIDEQPGPNAHLPAFGLARATIEAPSHRTGSMPAPTRITLDVVGRDSINLLTLPVGLPVEPPGFRLGPGLTPWTLEDWSDGAPSPAPPPLSFYALLHRRAPGSTDATDTSWQLHIECPTPDGSDPGLLRIYLGPSNAPSATLRIDPAGLMTEEIQAPLERDPVSITTTPGAWIATIDIPPSAIEPGGILRLAIERYNQAGQRATWPRPALPWQPAPGRAALDLSAWNSLTPAEDD
jgi:hypothetical protein